MTTDNTQVTENQTEETMFEKTTSFFKDVLDFIIDNPGKSAVIGGAGALGMQAIQSRKLKKELPAKDYDVVREKMVLANLPLITAK